MNIVLNEAKFSADVAARAKKYWSEIYRATEEATDYVWGNLPRYPAAARRSFPFKTFRQRLFVIRSIADGTMQVPYRRTNQLNRSITKEIRATNLGFGAQSVIGLIGTNLEYAAWVISNAAIPGVGGPQSQYHSGVWYTLQDEVTKQRAAILRIFEKHLDAAAK